MLCFVFCESWPGLPIKVQYQYKCVKSAVIKESINKILYENTIRWTKSLFHQHKREEKSFAWIHTDFTSSISQQLNAASQCWLPTLGSINLACRLLLDFYSISVSFMSQTVTPGPGAELYSQFCRPASLVASVSGTAMNSEPPERKASWGASLGQLNRLLPHGGPLILNFGPLLGPLEPSMVSPLCGGPGFSGQAGRSTVTLDFISNVAESECRVSSGFSSPSIEDSMAMVGVALVLYGLIKFASWTFISSGKRSAKSWVLKILNICQFKKSEMCINVL